MTFGVQLDNYTIALPVASPRPVYPLKGAKMQSGRLLIDDIDHQPLANPTTGGWER